MLEDLLSRLTDGAEVVTGSGLKARQLQTALTDEILAPGSVDLDSLLDPEALGV